MPAKPADSKKESFKMKRMVRIALLTLIPMALVLSGCNFIGRPVATDEQIGEELEELQALIPVLEAGLAVAASGEDSRAESATYAGRASVKTINAGVLWPATDPDAYDIYGGGTADAEGWVRYPYADGEYLTTFYGSAGTSAEFFVKPYDNDLPASADIWRVKLYIYPTLSTTVDYVLEEYLVVDVDVDTARAQNWLLVDETGVEDPTYYLNNRTVYIDGSVQEHEVVWNSAVDATYYDLLFEDAAGSDYLDAESTVYDFPTSISAAAPAAVIAGSIASGTPNYSVQVVSTIADTGVSVVEFYTEITIDTELVKSAVSYVTKRYVSGLFEESATTVRRYIEYADGTKIVRASTTSVSSFGSLSISPRTITEEVDIAINSSNLYEFDSTTTSKSGTTTNYTTVVELTQSTDAIGSYTGTSTQTTVTGMDIYSITLTDPSNLNEDAGEMSISGTDTSITYPVSRKEFRPSRDPA